MKVMKFGGTSVGTPTRMKEVTNLVIKSGEPVFVVLSAMAGTTNSLVDVSNYLYKKNPEGANDVINQLERKYMQHIDELFQVGLGRGFDVSIIKCYFHQCSVFNVQCSV